MLRKLFRDSAVYTVATLLTTGLSFVLLPIYARVLSPSEYGDYDYMMSLGLVVGVTVALEVTQAVMYHLAQKGDQQHRADVVAAGFWIVVTCYTTFCLLVVVFSGWFADVLLGSSSQSALLVVAAFQFFAVALVRLWTVVERSLLRPWHVLVISVGSAFLAGVLGVLGVRSHGVVGLVAGLAIGQGLVGITVSSLRWRQVLRAFPRAVVHRLLAFSSPLILSSVAFILASYVDRFFVRSMLGVEALGFYGFGARLASGVMLLLVGFQSALSPLIYAQLDRKSVHEDVARVFRLFILGAAAALLALMVSADLIVRLVGSDSYAPATPVLRLLAAAALIQGSYIFFPGLYIAQRTWVLAAIHVFGVVLNAMLNILLIPHLGLSGSAMATLIAGSAIFTLNYAFSQRYFRVPVFRTSRSR